ncbi:MAG: hypothetical protein HY234_12835 [Acidobacteria bacterium]|nr:hypothetical protein [Acidobacteriota bacterium]MBI3663921.1 hypothetical protein [Acidobacteriota bacterium]
MKITVNLSKDMIARIKSEAVRLGCTVSEIANHALRLYFKTRGRERKLIRLPSRNLGPALVDIADRDALYEAMDDLNLYRRD